MHVTLNKNRIIAVSTLIRMNDDSDDRTRFTFFPRNRRLIVEGSDLRPRPASDVEKTVFKNAITWAHHATLDDLHLANWSKRVQVRVCAKESRLRRALGLVEAALQ